MQTMIKYSGHDMPSGESWPVRCCQKLMAKLKRTPFLCVWGRSL